MSSTESAVANGDTRTIRLYHAHTGESIEATYRVNGHYDPAVLEKLNWFLRDWRRNEQTRMDPRLFDAVWEAYRAAGATQPITVLCGYRSPQTNAMLRSRSRMSGVAEHSQHILGKAMDTTMPGMSMERVREMAMRLQMGGVGYYPSTNFVHIDVGGVRSWPRMSYDQLARLFPDGKTVHIASNGRTLPRYEEARAELQERGSIEVPPSSQGTNFFAWLFGAGNHAEDEREEVAVAAPAAPPVRAASRSRAAADTRLTAEYRQQDTSRSVAMAEVSKPHSAERDDRQMASNQVASNQVASNQVAANVVPLRGGRHVHDQDADADTAPHPAMPLPPARPLALAALVDVPLPPERVGPAPIPAPVVTASAQPATPLPLKRETQTASMISPLRLASLPNLITQGSNRASIATTPASVLAYAPAQIEGLRSAARSRKAGPAAQVAMITQVPPPLVPARLDQSNFLAMTGSVETARLPSQTMFGATIAGLRQVAQNELRIQAGSLSHVALVAQPAEFQVASNDLPTDHFVDPTGTAYASRTGTDHVHVMVGSLALKSSE